MKKSVAVLAASAALLGLLPAVANAKTLVLFSKPIPGANNVFDPNGNPVGENQPPPVGSTFVGADRDYKGTRKHHSKRAVGGDHIVCTLLDATFTAVRCNAIIVLRDGEIIADNALLDFSKPSQTLKVTVGTGRYRHAKTVTNRNEDKANTSELVIRY